MNKKIIEIAQILTIPNDAYCNMCTNFIYNFP